MKELYDNCEMLIGEIDKVIERTKKEIEKNGVGFDTTEEEVLKDLEDLKENGARIVCVNYSCPMGYLIHSWKDSDILDKE